MLTGEGLVRIGWNCLSLCFAAHSDLLIRYRVEGNPKLFYLICPINGCVKEFY